MMVSTKQCSSWAFALIAFTLISSVSAQWEYLQKVVNPDIKLVKTKKPLADIPVHSITFENYKEILQDSTVDWLALFTSDPEHCPSCIKYEKVFNDTLVALQDRKDVRFAKIDCEKETLLCNIFSAWGSSLYYIHHTEEPSSAVSAQGVPLVHRTHLYTVPFHRPGAENIEIAEPDGTKTDPQPAPDAIWVEEVIRKNLWKDLKEWNNYSQPFEGSAKDLLIGWWWFVQQFGKVPPFVTMIGVSFLGRWLTGQISNRSTAKRQAREAEQRTQAAAQAAKAK